ncbi:hypothetical protein HGQ17_07970 [Nesterenkonia sp. MY13]|uniref:Multidrug ABC transporter ATPase n=1 Tax=Nesterenkonia sedimenti TaxID=1463632 RepID=A0A7X8YDQ6_9MICC|nr:hypothetical protein [Nesterenkonia sedimenti]NLS09938.1 hypothetical protein [Nesterenkonia sedimenti]
MSSSASPLLRAILVLGVIATAVSFAALLVILGMYFTPSDAHPALYGTALWGFPVAFVLMCTYMMLSLGRRRQAH